jgi:hypothetical protein
VYAFRTSSTHYKKILQSLCVSHKIVRPEILFLQSLVRLCVSQDCGNKQKETIVHRGCLTEKGYGALTSSTTWYLLKKEVREHPLISENFVNRCYRQNNGNQNAEIAHTHSTDSGLDRNSLVCLKCNSGVCDRALKNAQKVTNVTIFCCLSIFATTNI